MRQCVTACLLTAGLLVAAPLFAQSKAKAQNVPEIPYDSVPNFLKFPPNLYLGEGIGVATNSKGHVFVYTRSGETRLFEFDQNGTFVREIGQGLYGFAFAHAVRVDPQDNIWAVDEGTNMVIKFNPAGRVVMVLGRRPEAVDELAAMSGNGSQPNSNKPYSFNRPTDVGWDAQGNIFVTDGYGDNRVVKYDKNGRFIKSAGTRGQRSRAAQAAAHDGDGCAGQRLHRRPQQRARAGVGQRSESQGELRPGRQPVGGVRLARAASVSVSCRTRCPTTATRAPPRRPARSTRWSSTAPSSASSARPARR